jgi:CheY-like chemotaxis protein
VEDEQIIAEDLALRVGAMGHDVVGFAISGEEAIALAREKKPDLVLMDIRLEGRMTGVEAAHFIREKTNATIIFVTAYPGTLLREVPDLTEREICVNKPWSKAQLEIAINKALARRFTGPSSPPPALHTDRSQ